MYCLEKSLKYLTNQLDYERNDIFQAGMVKYKLELELENEIGE